MGLTGKYDFPGIKSKGAKGIELLLGSFGWFSALMIIPIVGPFIDGCLGLLVNYLANKGLIIFNIVDIVVEGKFDQEAFDSAMDAALKSVSANKDTLTDAQKKAIDDSIIKALRKFGPLSSS